MSTHEIVCPNCKTAFTIDEAGYADLLLQVRNQEFESEILSLIHISEPTRH